MTASPQKSSLVQPFYPALDGLRAVAFLMVFSVHYVTMVSSWRIFQWGWAGVDLFFVLSGFLITGILYDSMHRKDYFRNFYVRRTLRIFPLFYAFWLVALLATPLLHIVWNRYNVATMLYFGNFFIGGAQLGLHPDATAIAYRSIHHAGELRFITCRPLWSLCVEEQFYLLWPAIVWLIRSRAALLRFCLAMVVVLPFARLIYIHLHPEMVAAGSLYHSSWGRVDTLLVGAALALWLRGPAPAVHILRRASIATLVLCPCLLAIFLLRDPRPLGDPFSNPVVSGLGYTLIALASAGLLVLALDPSTIVFRALRVHPLLFLGRLSYGMYFFHALPSGWLYSARTRFTAHHVGWLLPAIALAYSLCAAMLSFRFLESPFLRLKPRLAPRPGSAEDPPPFSEEASSLQHQSVA